MKYKSILMVLALLLVSCSWLPQKTVYLNQDKFYKDFIGKKYILIKDCYVFKVVSDSSFKYPMIACPDTYRWLPSPVNQGLIGKTYNNSDNILGVITKGSQFSIFSIKEYSNFETSRVVFELKFEDNNINVKWPVLETSQILKAVPRQETSIHRIIDENVAQPVQ